MSDKYTHEQIETARKLFAICLGQELDLSYENRITNALEDFIATRGAEDIKVKVDALGVAGVALAALRCGGPCFCSPLAVGGHTWACANATEALAEALALLNVVKR